MNAKHTKEPWEMRAPRADWLTYTQNITVKGGGKHVANVHSRGVPGHPKHFGHGEAIANARRIIACVNACQGIDPRAVPMMFEACRKLANLAEAIGHCLGTWTPQHTALAQEYAAEARAALAAAKEEPTP